jgi:hypothetical protein
MIEVRNLQKQFGAVAALWDLHGIAGQRPRRCLDETIAGPGMQAVADRLEQDDVVYGG